MNVHIPHMLTYYISTPEKLNETVEYENLHRKDKVYIFDN